MFEVFEVIDQLIEIITNMGCKNYEVGATGHLIFVDNGLWFVIVNENYPKDIFLNLHVKICPLKAADITKRLSYHASMIGMNVVIENIFAVEYDEAGNFRGITYGPDAYKSVGREHYFGELYNRQS